MNELLHKIHYNQSWWRRNWLLRRIRHLFGWCDGIGMVQGTECYFCAEESFKRRIRYSELIYAKYYIGSSWYDNVENRELKVMLQTEDGVWMWTLPEYDKQFFPFGELNSSRLTNLNF